MRARCSLVVNGRTVRVSTGDTPLEAALAEGMIAAGQAVHGGALLGQGGAVAGRRTRAGRKRAETALLPAPSPSPAIAARPEPRPTTVTTRTGTVARVSPLGPGVMEVVVVLARRMSVEPGHEVLLLREGAPPLRAAPTLPADGMAELDEMVFHLPRDADGAPPPGLSPEAGLRVKGPVGRGQYRPGGGRLVLVAAGTGFAPIWAIARAARYVEPTRDMALVVGARDPLDLYMRESLDWLRRTGVGRTVLCADRARQRPPDVRPGPLTAHLPSLYATDVVHVAGPAPILGAVQALAGAVGARCYPIAIEAD